MPKEKKNKKVKSKKQKEKALKNSAVATLEKEEKVANITIVGVGGGGCNILHNLNDISYDNVRIVAMNTDEEALSRSVANETLLIGKNRTKGLGAQRDAAIGYEAAMENKQQILKTLDGSDLVFIVAGLGGGTGTGASLVIAEAAKSLGANVVVVVTTPFAWEGQTSAVVAQKGVDEFKKIADNVIVLHNADVRKHLESMGKPTELRYAFRSMDEVIGGNIEAIIDLISSPGLINLEFSDVLSVFAQGNTTSIASGEATEGNRGKVAAENALKNPFFAFDIKEAKGIMITVTGGNDFTFDDLDNVSEVVHSLLPSSDLAYHPTNPFAGENAPCAPFIIVGAILKDSPAYVGKVKVSITAVK